MKSKKENIENEVEKTLGQFNNKEKLTPDPYFYSKIQSRIGNKNRNRNESPINLILKPALLMILILFNLATILLYKDGNKSSQLENQQSQLIEVLSGDLNLNQTQQSVFFEN